MSKQTFVANTILTAAQMNTLQANDYNQTVSTKTVSYVLVATDAGTKIVMNAAGATTITVNTSLFTAGDNLTIANIGAGVCTITAGTATVSSAGPLAIPQYGTGTLYFTSAGVSIYSPTAVTAAAPASGLTFIAAGQITAQTSFTISNCFSATYNNYKFILYDAVNSSINEGINLRYGISTADTANEYYNAVDGVYSTLRTFHPLGNLGTAANGFSGGGTSEIQSPNLAAPTTIQSLKTFITSSAGGLSTLNTTLKIGTTQYTSIFLTGAGVTNFTCKYAIYGYQLS